MIKKVIVLSSLFLICINGLVAQKSESDGGFDINKLFAGGNLVLGYGGNSGTSYFTIGANPEIGYTLYKSLDMGLCFNVINQSGSYYEYNNRVKYNIFDFGIGLFTRLHISDGLFIQAQPEFNNIKYKASIDGYSGGLDTTFKSTSFLMGIGYGTRDIGNVNFFTSILIDLQNNLYSPYRNSAGQIIPQIRGGMNWYFRKKRKK